MLKYDPVPGRINDIINIAMLKADYEGYIENFLDNCHEYPCVQTQKIFEYIHATDLLVNDAVGLLLENHKHRSFLLYFLHDLNAYFSFGSVEPFLEWIHNVDKACFLSHLLSYLSKDTLSVAECESIIENKPKLSQVIQSFQLSEHDRYRLMIWLFDVDSKIEELYQILLKSNAILQNILFRFQEYLAPKMQAVESLEKFYKINRHLNIETFELDRINIDYSFVCINCPMIYHYLDHDTKLCIMLGVEFEWSYTRVTNRTAFKTFHLEVLGKALSDGKRIDILRLLEDGELYATEISNALDIPNNSLFYHVNLLREANLITSQVDGRKVFYRINLEALYTISEYFKQYYNKLKQGGTRNEVDKTGS